jgi:hypothetical protein
MALDLGWIDGVVLHRHRVTHAAAGEEDPRWTRVVWGICNLFSLREQIGSSTDAQVESLSTEDRRYFWFRKEQFHVGRSNILAMLVNIDVPVFTKQYLTDLWIKLRVALRLLLFCGCQSSWFASYRQPFLL